MIQFGATPYLKACAYYLRMEVFVKEQQIPWSVEYDESLQDETPYFVYFVAGAPVATLRYQIKDGKLNPDRLCVLKDFRKRGIGSQLLHAMEKLGQENQLTEAFLWGEVAAQAFYLKNGYQTAAKEVSIDTIPCYLFTKKIG
ncbi:GNAT family N-acetyltransferase [Enterococcus nangangensis]|uniref:GNAT family N-acetyltransferase n=1 Tax=Enterococcus nangangensis TaxID=2559926 RepID=UPI0010F43DFC|nr:GNAT family N-acetyltransferase [Enterococcus nangangensis]